MIPSGTNLAEVDPSKNGMTVYQVSVVMHVGSLANVQIGNKPPYFLLQFLLCAYLLKSETPVCPSSCVSRTTLKKECPREAARV